MSQPPRSSLSRVTSKFQATIPQPIRDFLGIERGDTVAFEIDDGVVKLSRAKPRDLAYAEALEGTLSEWTSDADEQAYRVT